MKLTRAQWFHLRRIAYSDGLRRVPLNTAVALARRGLVREEANGRECLWYITEAGRALVREADHG